MLILNSRIAEAFNQVADLLEIEGANQFRVRAYRNAARVVSTWPENLASAFSTKKELPSLPGLGEDLKGKVVSIIQTGRLPVLEDLKQRVSPSIAGLLTIPGLGPKRVRLLRDKLGIKSLTDLEKAAHQKKIRTVAGFSQKTEDKILEELNRNKTSPKRFLRPFAIEVAEPLIIYLKGLDGVERCEIAGSFRRASETVGDLDILISCAHPKKIMKSFVEYEDVEQVLSYGTTRSAIILQSGIQVDLRVVEPRSYGAALIYFTGSKAHNVAIRGLGIKKGYKLNEYGIFKGSRRVAGGSEAEVYSKLGLPWIAPELREDRGEIEAAFKNNLPQLIEVHQIRGDLHAHTDATDGRLTLAEMVRAAQKRGYEYLAITDHSKHLTVASGLNTKRLLKQIREIDRLNAKLSGFRVLKSIEVDILEDGTLDLPDDVLRLLDFTVCSVHYKFNLSRAKQTERIIRAMNNPYFTILGHPTGRIIGYRQPYDVDLEAIMKAAKDKGKILELNCQPDRLDLNDTFLRMAKNIGLKISINTDAHDNREFDFINIGIGQARRGWLTKDDVINTKTLKDLLKVFRRKRESA